MTKKKIKYIKIKIIKFQNKIKIMKKLNKY